MRVIIGEGLSGEIKGWLKMHIPRSNHVITIAVTCKGFVIHELKALR